ncbi:MAG: hypothetical protein V3T20_05315 [Gemmatimonadota bacterium]
MRPISRQILPFHLTLICLALVWLAGCAAESERRPLPARSPGAITIASDHGALVEGFEWARDAALGYAREGEPVGKWFEAALPGREAFCMRDVSHQTEGALALGLYDHTFNMMRKFAASISPTRDWCGYWEIDRYDRPAPVDYRSDEDFWYNLPANFDVVQASERAWEWTGDSAWLNDPSLAEFYRRSLGDYVESWDADGDGIMESPESAGIRGIPTYWEGKGPRPATGGDLVAAQYAANRAYARMIRARDRPGDVNGAEGFENEANRLRGLYNERWWSAERDRFYGAILPNGSFDTTYVPAMQIFPLYFTIVDPARAERLFEGLEPGVNVEENSYLAEAHYRYGRDAEAFEFLLAQMDPGLERREYPENPFTAVSGVVRWLAGVRPLASARMVETRSRLPGEVEWIELSEVPVLDGSLRLRHEGRTSTRLTLQSGSWARWRAVFPGLRDTLFVDGEPVAATHRRTMMGEVESFVVLDLQKRETRTVTVSRD